MQVWIAVDFSIPGASELSHLWSSHWRIFTMKNENCFSFLLRDFFKNEFFSWFFGVYVDGMFNMTAFKFIGKSTIYNVVLIIRAIIAAIDEISKLSLKESFTVSDEIRWKESLFPVPMTGSWYLSPVSKALKWEMRLCSTTFSTSSSLQEGSFEKSSERALLIFKGRSARLAE